jgi:carboxylesterase
MHPSRLFRNPHLDGSSFYWQSGDTGVLLCHGFTATTTEVRLLAEALHQHGYTVAAPLLPGHGTSPEDCNRHTWQDWYAVVVAGYQQLKANCRQVVVGGESTGALLTLLLAHDHPEAAVILCYAPALQLKLSRSKTFLFSLMAPFITAIPKAPSTNDHPWKGYTVNPLKGARELIRLQKVIHPLLPHIRQPTLIVQGRLDPTVHPQAPQVIHDRIGSSMKELHWLDNSAHCVILDKERDLAASLTLDFLHRVLSA